MRFRLELADFESAVYTNSTIKAKRRGWDSNPCAQKDKRFSRPPCYDHFATSPDYRLTAYFDVVLFVAGPVPAAFVGGLARLLRIDIAIADFAISRIPDWIYGPSRTRTYDTAVNSRVL